MTPPENARIFDIAISTMWFDEEGIFCSVTKKNAPITKETLNESFEIIKANARTEKICWLGNVTNMSSPSKQARDFAAEETPKFVKALALITNSPLSKVIANIFFQLKKLSYPTKMFTDEIEAKKWLRQYL